MAVITIAPLARYLLVAPHFHEITERNGSDLLLPFSLYDESMSEQKLDRTSEAVFSGLHYLFTKVYFAPVYDLS